MNEATRRKLIWSYGSAGIMSIMAGDCGSGKSCLSDKQDTKRVRILQFHLQWHIKSSKATPPKPPKQLYQLGSTKLGAKYFNI